MKVLHVAETMPGGIASHLEEILPAQVALYGAENVALLCAGKEWRLIRNLDQGMPVYEYAKTGRNPRSFLNGLVATVRATRRFAPDIVHVHSSIAGAFVRLAPTKGTVVYCPHGWSFAAPAPYWRNAMKAGAERILAYFCDAIVNVSFWERSLAQGFGVPDGKMRVIRNGIADNVASTGQDNVAEGEAAPDDDGPVRVLFFGRFDFQKGIDIAFAAARQLDGRSDLRFDFIGEAVVGSPLALGEAPEHATLHGWVPRSEVEEHIRRCDIVMMPSRWEGLPIAALETMRLGKAIVATNATCFPEIIDDGVSGVLFDIARGADGLAEKLATLTKAQCRAMGRMARAKYLQEFQASRQVNEISALYDELSARRSAR